MRVGDEEDDLAALARPPDLRDPVADPSAEVLRRLRRDVLQARLVLDRERLERDRAFEPRSRVLPRDHECLRLGNLVALRRRFLVAGDDLLGQLLAVRVNFVRLGDEHARLAVRPEVIEHRRGTIGRFTVRQKVLQGNDGGLVDRQDRALRRGIVGADRLDGVADELEADRLPGAGRVEVDHAAAHAELSGLVHRILPRVAGGGEKVAEIDRGDLLTGHEGQRCRLQMLRRADARQQAGGGSNDDPRRPGRQRMQRACARRSDVHVGREPAIGIDFVRRKGEHRSFSIGVRQTFERGDEEPHIAGHALDVAHRSARSAARDRGLPQRRHTSPWPPA